MKKIISLLMALLLVAALLCGCGNPETPSGGDKVEESIVGAWMAEIGDEKQGYVFLEDGTGYATILPMTYTTEGDMLNIHIEAFNQVQDLSMKYKVSGDKLTLDKDGEIIELVRTEMPEELK